MRSERESGKCEVARQGEPVQCALDMRSSFGRAARAGAVATKQNVARALGTSISGKPLQAGTQGAAVLAVAPAADNDESTIRATLSPPLPHSAGW